MHMISRPKITINLALLHIYISLLEFVFFAFCIHIEDLSIHIVCSPLPDHYDLSFNARSAPITSTGAVLPVTF